MKLMIFSISQQSMVTQQVNGDGFIYITMEKNEEQLRTMEMIKLSTEESENLIFHKFASTF